MRICVIDPATNAVLCTFSLTNGVETIGRSSESSHAIPGKFTSISGVHLTLRSSADIVEIMDGNGRKNSVNGIFVNGIRIPSETWARVSTADKIYLGAPNAFGSLRLELNNTDQRATSKTSGTPSIPRNIPTIPERSSVQQTNPQTPSYSSSKNTTQVFGKDTLSKEMRLRLERIDRYLDKGYSLGKSQHAFPIFVGQDGRSHFISIFNSPAGFSWIGFFFPFAVCTQIREWSYFYVILISGIITSKLFTISGSDLGSISIDFAISIMYGIYYPYLRHLALSKSVHEISKTRSIVIGILLSIVASLPGFLLTYFSQPS